MKLRRVQTTPYRVATAMAAIAITIALPLGVAAGLLVVTNLSVVRVARSVSRHPGRVLDREAGEGR